MSAGIAMALRYGCPIIPMHLRGRNSALFYLLWFLNTELKDMTLFRELLNKNGARYDLTIAAPVVPAGDAEALTLSLQDFVTQAMPRGARHFAPLP
jgi:putative hemolysin